jgi:ubiquinone/menaquinone biosynthesis C-methylase UbiE
MNKHEEHFNELADSYESSWKQDKIFKPVQQKCIDTAITLGANPSFILDLGCGAGSLLRQCGTVWEAAELAGIDPAPNMIKIARSLTPNAVFHCGYPENLPFADESVDLAFTTMSFHHWNDHDKSLKEIHRVLTRNGYFILGDVSVPRWFAWITKEPQSWNTQERQKILEPNGFEILSQDKCLQGFALVTSSKRL